MIKIITGTYGYVNDKGIIEPKDSSSNPFSLAPEKEAELVARGIAVIVEDEDNDSDDNPSSLETMKFNDLKKYAKELGIKAPANATKDELIQLIQSSNENDNEDEDNENDNEDEDNENDGAPNLEALGATND